MTVTDWIIVAGSIGGGIFLGIVASKVVSSVLAAEGRPHPIQEAAKPLGSLAFWGFVIVGLMASLSVLQPQALEDIPRDLIEFLPRVISAAILVIGAAVASSFVLAAITPALARSSPSLQRQVSLIVRSIILGLATVVAVTQLGIDTAVINIAIAAIFFGAAASFTLLVGLGGRDVAHEVAAGRAVRKLISEGDTVTVENITGTVMGIRPTAVELASATGETILVPCSKFVEQTLTLVAEGQ